MAGRRMRLVSQVTFPNFFLILNITCSSPDVAFPLVAVMP